MKYEVGDKVKINKEKSGIGYSLEFIDFLEENDYKLTISDTHSYDNNYYLAEEMQNNDYFKDCPLWGSYIKEVIVEVIVEEVLDPIFTRFEILDL